MVCTPISEALIDSCQQDDDGPGAFTVDDASPPLPPAAPGTRMAASPASMQARRCAPPHCAMRPCGIVVMCAWQLKAQTLRRLPEIRAGPRERFCICRFYCHQDRCKQSIKIRQSICADLSSDNVKLAGHAGSRGEGGADPPRRGDSSARKGVAGRLRGGVAGCSTTTERKANVAATWRCTANCAATPGHRA